MRRLRRMILTSAIAGGSAIGLMAPPAHAAPISCPPNQQAEKQGGTWVCVNQNGGGHSTGAGWHNGTGDKI